MTARCKPGLVLSTLTRERYTVNSSGYRIQSPTISPAALDPVTMTLSDVQTHLHASINSSKILLDHSLESDLHALQLLHLRCIGTAIFFHHPRGRPLKPGLAWLTRMWLGYPTQDRGPGGVSHCDQVDGCSGQEPGVGADYDPGAHRAFALAGQMGTHGDCRPRCLARYVGDCAHNDRRSPVRICADDAEGLNELLGALDSHEFVFGRPTGLADTLRCA
ncbi:hypothetical protein EDB85DRAFT_608345 [Lactarius pseudohatsudake]|nr:hypothetical protein EDB85DRAFT_608345 [Lactarius pseudohatsudake]